MRSLTICVLFSTLAGVATAQSNILDKRFTLSFSDVTLEDALSTVSKISSVEFSYSDDVVPIGALVSLRAEERTLQEILNSLLQGFRVEYKVVHGRIVFRKAPAPLTQTVRGSVVDLYTHTPIIGANIIVEDSNPLLGSTTDADGKFKIPNVPVGRSTLRITSIGYESKTLSNILLGTGKELVLEVKLVESLTSMEEVVITAHQNEPALSEQSMVSARSFSVEETKRYAGSLGDPARMASSFAGVTGASDESNALIVRGNSPRGVLWRVDGIEVPNPNHFATEGSSNGIVSVLSSNIIDNSDFLTGAFPAIYGNALSAVFDMKLRSGNNERREHSFQAGLLGVEASTEGPISKQHSSSYLLNYRYSTLNILDKLGVDLNAAGEYKNYQDLSFKVDFPFSNGSRLSVFGIGGLSKTNFERTDSLAHDAADMGVIGATYQKPLGERTSLLTSMSWSGTQITNLNELTGLSAGVLKLEEHYSKNYLRASVIADQKISERFFLRGGLTYSQLYYNFYLRNQDPNNQAYSEIVNFQEQGNTGITQVFLTAHQNFSETLSGVYGVHFIRFGMTNDNSAEPRIGLRWHVTPGKFISAGFGKHSRIENLQYYLARDHQVGGDEVQVNKNLGFTRAYHYVAAYEQTVGKARVKLEGYYQQLYNAPVQSDPASMYTTLNEDTGFVTDTLLNTGKGRNYGVELSLERSFSNNFYYLLNGSLYQSRFQVAEEQERNTAYNGNYNFHILFGKEFRLHSNRDILGLSVKFTGAGGRPYIPIDLAKSIAAGGEVYDWAKAFEPQLPDYFRTDFQVVYRKNKPRYSVEWRLDIQNVTNHVNPAYYYFDEPSQRILLKYQVGFLPILSYRIEF